MKAGALVTQHPVVARGGAERQLGQISCLTLPNGLLFPPAKICRFYGHFLKDWTAPERTWAAELFLVFHMLRPLVFTNNWAPRNFVFMQSS